MIRPLSIQTGDLLQTYIYKLVVYILHNHNCVFYFYPHYPWETPPLRDTNGEDMLCIVSCALGALFCDGFRGSAFSSSEGGWVHLDWLSCADGKVGFSTWKTGPDLFQRGGCSPSLQEALDVKWTRGAFGV